MVLIRSLCVALVPGLALLSCPHAPTVAAPAGSIWDGVYTGAQASRGEFVYPSVCGRCHGHRLDGAPDDPDFFSTPPLAGPKFLRKWNGGSLAALFEYMLTTMPEINPGSLSDQEFVDLLAYLLAVSGAPAGPTELAADPAALAGIMIEPEPRGNPGTVVGSPP